jgi:hypothetical protein
MLSQRLCDEQFGVSHSTLHCNQMAKRKRSDARKLFSPGLLLLLPWQLPLPPCA